MTTPLTDRAILLRPEDDVAIAKRELTKGSALADGAATIEVRADIKPGHKVARHAVRLVRLCLPQLVEGGDRVQEPHLVRLPYQ